MREIFSMTASVVLYGIPNCDTIKKARKWLEQREISYQFHDYKKSGVNEGQLRAWAAELGWEALLNKSGTTFRKLSDAEKSDIGMEKAIALMLANPSMIKRPVLDIGIRRIVGFKPEVYEAAFS